MPGPSTLADIPYEHDEQPSDLTLTLTSISHSDTHMADAAKADNAGVTTCACLKTKPFTMVNIQSYICRHVEHNHTSQEVINRGGWCC